MTRVLVAVREPGKLKPEYYLNFDLPELPRIGDYISIHRPDKELHSEDLVVRHVWWRLHHPETRGVVEGEEKVGKIREIVVECDQALGPSTSDDFRRSLKSAKERGIEVEVFDMERPSVREIDLPTKA